MGALRTAVARAGHVVDEEVYAACRALYAACEGREEALRALAPEYGREECLLCVDRRGQAARVPQEVRRRLARDVERDAAFGRWLRVAQSAEGPALLAARWLCHLAGLRHRTVELFIDLPWGAYTLLQVRSVHKAEAPCCFDVPAAGHVAGLTPPHEALWQELHEELGLGADDLEEVRELGVYEYADPWGEPPPAPGEKSAPGDEGVRAPGQAGFWGVEYRHVFCARLTARSQEDVLSRIRFVDGEVAAVCVFARAEVGAMLETCPERAASGLRDSWPLYVAARERGAA